MSAESFQLIDSETIDISIIKGNFVNVYQQQRAQISDPDQNLGITSGENNNYHQIGNSYFEFDRTIRKLAANPTDRVLTNAPVIRLVSNAFCLLFQINQIKN